MSLFPYIAILGRQPELGLVELESVLGADALRRFGVQSALLSRDIGIDRLGGAVKIGRILYQGVAEPLRELPVEWDDLPLGESKTPFALSVYGAKTTSGAARAAGLEIKKRLRGRGPVRLVMPAKGTAATAAELRHNRVLEQGFELLVVVSGQEMVVALTKGVQDIDWYSKRDYERPARSAKVGMLPPKLAQVLVNTTSAPLVTDPFCGTGVVLQEALLSGREAHGSDLAPEMVAASRTNLEWLTAQPEAGGALPVWEVTEADAKTVRLAADSAMVSEGYLGRNLSRSPTPAELARLRRELLDLYRAALTNWARQLAGGAEVSLCVPAWRVGKKWHYLGLVDELPRLGYTAKGFKHVHTPLLYERPDQIVGRQLLFLRKY
jgi:tRNA G10  N-methylase Trm11